MGEMTFTEIAELLKDLGLTGGLIVGVWVLIKGEVVPGAKEGAIAALEHINGGNA